MAYSLQRLHFINRGFKWQLWASLDARASFLPICSTLIHRMATPEKITAFREASNAIEREATISPGSLSLGAVLSFAFLLNRPFWFSPQYQANPASWRLFVFCLPRPDISGRWFAHPVKLRWFGLQKPSSFSKQFLTATPNDYNVSLLSNSLDKTSIFR